MVSANNEPLPVTDRSNDSTPSRRDAIKAGLAALAGLGVTAVMPSTAHAAAGGNFILGQSNDGGASNTTLLSSSAYALRVTSSAGTGLRADASANNTNAIYANGTGGSAATINAHASGTASSAVGGRNTATDDSARGVHGTLAGVAATGTAVEGVVLDGAASGTAVRGVTYGTRTAVEAEISNAANAGSALHAKTNGVGYAIRAEGGKAQLYVVPGSNVHAPATGTHEIGEVYVDADGAIFTCVSAGTPGVWRPLLTTLVDTAVEANVDSDDAALRIAQLGSGWGVVAYTIDEANDKAAVDASGMAGPGVRAWSAADVGVSAYGGRANLALPPIQGASGPPSSGSHEVGDVYSAGAGVVYLCTAAGTPGVWEALLHTGRNIGSTTLAASSPGSLGLRVEGGLAVDGAASVGGGFSVGGATSTGSLGVNGTAGFAGQVNMSRSGKVRIPKGKSSVKVKVPGGLAGSATFLCTPQNSGGSGVAVKYAKRVSATQFQIVLTKKTTAAMYVGWMVLG